MKVHSTIFTLLLLPAGIFAQVPFAYKYNTAPSFSNVSRANNHDLFLTNGSLNTGLTPVLRLSPSGIPIWSTSIQASSGTGAVLERQNGELLVCTRTTEPGMGQMAPAYHRLDANGNWLGSRYYSLGTINAWLAGSIITSLGQMVTVFASEDHYGLISVDGSGGFLWSRLFPINQLFPYYKIIAGNAGTTLMFYTSSNLQLCARRVYYNGDVMWEKAFTVNGITDARVRDAAQVGPNMYAVLAEVGAMNAVAVLYIDGNGEVLSAHAYEPPIQNTLFGNIWNLGQGQILLRANGILARIDTSGQIIGPVPYDNASAVFLGDALAIDTASAYLIYAPDVVMLRSLTAPASSCEVLGTFIHLATTATSISIVDPSIPFFPTEVEFSPVTTSNNVSYTAACVLTGLHSEENSGAVLDIHPNPITGNAIHLNSETVYTLFRVHDLSGAIVRSGSITADRNISVQDLRPGSYVLEVTDGSRTSRTRFVKL